MNKEHILREIKRAAEANGGVPLGRLRFLAETGIREADWLGRFWARWGDAIREAGYSPNQLQAAYETEFLLETYIGLIRELKKVPASGDLRLKAGNDPDFPNWKTFDRLGSKSEVVKRVLEYCRERSGYEDVTALCEQYSPRLSKSPVAANEKDDEGFVYLMKSGKFYKLGRSNAAGRREYELGIQLPEKLKTVHIIRTDDPVGIEAYWHRRFEEKRKNGEWFDLGAAEVAAFKRRKFM
jgi:Meiotically up-regulated gene 113